MKAIPKLLLGLAFTLSVGVGVHSQNFTPGQLETDRSGHATAEPSPIQLDSESLVSADHREVTRYATAFDGDHILEAAIAAEQAFARYTLYIVRLKVVMLNNGHDQLTVAISSGSFAPGEGRASGPHEFHHGLALASGSFKAKARVFL